MPPVGIRSGGPLNRLRANAKKMMPDTCTIQQAARVSDGNSGYTNGWTTVGSNISIRLDESTGENDSSLGLNTKVATFPFSVPWDAPLTADCRILHNGHTYEVWELADDQTPIIYRGGKLKRVDPTP